MFANYEKKKNSSLYSKSNISSLYSRKITQRSVTGNDDTWLASLPAPFFESAANSKELPVVLSIGGGKGGVGKSILSANVAAKLGQLGFKVLLVDLDIGSANLHTYFGLSNPRHNLSEFVVYNRSKFSDLLLLTPISGVYLIAGGKDESWCTSNNIDCTIFTDLWRNILASKQNHQFDFVILDLGAGTLRYTIDFFTSAHLGIITVLPEPTSIENAYSFLKVTLARLLDHCAFHSGQIEQGEKLKSLLFGQNIPQVKGSYAQKLEILDQEYHTLIEHLKAAIRARKIGFIVNQIRAHKDIEIGNSMESICNTYFGFSSRFLGYLNYDDAAWKSLRNRRPLVLDFPHCILTKRLTEVTGRILQTLGV